MVINVSQIL